MFLKKSYLLLIIFSIKSLISLPIESFQLQKVLVSTNSQIEQELTDLRQRELKRYAVKIGTTAAVLVAMYITYRAGEYFKKLDNRLEKVDKRVAHIEQNEEGLFKDLIAKHVAIEKKSSAVIEADVEPITVLTPLKYIASGIKLTATGVKNFTGDLGKSFITSCPAFITSAMLSALWQQVSSRVTQASKLETLSWYIEEHTQIWPLFHDISLASVPFDLHSELLSLQQVDNKAHACIRSYTEELDCMVKNHKEDSMYDGYFEYASKNLKKEYEKKSIELTELQNYAVPNIAKRKRAVFEGEGSLFVSDQLGRQNIVELVDLLTSQIQKMINFSSMCVDIRRAGLSKETIARGEKRIAQMVHITNQYLSHMEQLLHMDNKELESMSICNKGIFTCTYEFERLFKEQVNILHRYCLYIK